VIAHGRELAAKADRLRRAMDRQIEEVQATIEEAESVLMHTARVFEDDAGQ
jgi:outer membrane murein-binding lipoprotein Lpp